jgi:alpha/beta superfamily hydrolase
LEGKDPHHVIAFDNRGVGASTGTVPRHRRVDGRDAYTFIKALGFDTVDIFSFSLGGMVAQALVIKPITVKAFRTQLKAIKRWGAQHLPTCPLSASRH